MSTIFSETLTRLRKEAGFPTAYRFYYDNGGAPVLKISYRKYLALEQGVNLPAFARLGALIFGLRLIPRSSAAEDLIKAWLRTTAGEEPYRDLLEPMLPTRQTPVRMPPMHKAMKRQLAGRKYHIDLRQLGVISANRANHLCFLALANDTGWWTAKNLATQLRLGIQDAKTALNRLTEVKLLVKAKNGQYKNKLAKEMLEYPYMSSGAMGMMEKIKKYQEELIADGSMAWSRRGIIRADSATLRDFFPIMGVTISTAQAYAVTEKSEKSALFCVEGRITKLADF